MGNEELEMMSYALVSVKVRGQNSMTWVYYLLLHWYMKTNTSRGKKNLLHCNQCGKNAVRY